MLGLEREREIRQRGERESFNAKEKEKEISHNFNAKEKKEGDLAKLQP